MGGKRCENPYYILEIKPTKKPLWPFHFFTITPSVDVTKETKSPFQGIDDWGPRVDGHMDPETELFVGLRDDNNRLRVLYYTISFREGVD